MSKQLAFLLAVFLAFGSGRLPAQDTAATSDKAAVARLKKDIFYLAGPECEGRGVETEGINKAADYIAQSFKESGLKPAMPDGSYFMPFKISNAPKLGTANGAKLLEDGKETVLKLKENFSVCGVSASGKTKPLDIVFVGYGIEKDESFNDYAGVNVEGKAVVILRRTPKYGQDDSPFETAKFAPIVVKVAAAQKHKPAAIIFVNTKESGGTNDDLMTFDYSRGGPAAEVPVIQLKRKIVDEMLKGSKTNLNDIEESIEKNLKPQDYAMSGWKIAIDTDIVRGGLMAKNVIGVLEGSGPLADETVIIGAHYDHLGRGEPGSMQPGNKNVHFGADDNGSGTTSVLELARRFGWMKNRQGRRLVFMTFSGEERGLLGSAYYCEHPIFPLDKTAAMINLDMVGRLNKEGMEGPNKLEVGGVGTAKEFAGDIATLNKKYHLPITTSATGNGPSDHMSFNQVKVPVFFFFTGLHGQYHRPTDVPELINLEGMKKIVDMVEDLAVEMTTVAERPKFINVPGYYNPGQAPSVIRIGLIPGSGAYDETKDGGVPVGGASEGSPAAKAGLKQGDAIVEIAGKPIKNMTSYMMEMGKQKRGTTIEMTVLREGKKVTLKVDLPKSE